MKHEPWVKKKQETENMCPQVWQFKKNGLQYFCTLFNKKWIVYPFSLSLGGLVTALTNTVKSRWHYVAPKALSEEITSFHLLWGKPGTIENSNNPETTLPNRPHVGVNSPH